MSHKIKLNLTKATRPLEDLPNQKISISLDDKSNKKSKTIDQKATEKKSKFRDISKPVTYDHQLFKQFKKSVFFKIDLHGSSVEEAHQRLIKYFNKCYIEKKLLHVVVTGLGNKTSDGEFFTGKIRKMFPLWLETKPFEKFVKSYSPCKIQHGGLGAFYVKLKTKV